MKLQTTVDDFNSLPLLNKLFLAMWLKKKGYDTSKRICKCKIEELAFALTNDLRFETSLTKTTFNNSLQYEEYIVAWDGSEPIDILWYEMNKKLNRRILNYLVAHYRS